MAAATPPGSAGLDYLVVMDLEASGDDPYDVNREEIVEWPWVVFDLRRRIEVDAKQIYIAPQWGPNPNPSPAHVQSLGIDVAFSPSLKDAVAKFDTYLLHSFVLNQKSFCLLTDGPWDLRQVLAIEATRKGVNLASHFRTYFDLRTEFARCYPAGPKPNDRQTMVDFLSISCSGKTTGLESCRVIADIVTRLQNDGHVFANPNVFSEVDWESLWTRIPVVAIPVAAAVPVGGIVRLRGLPWTCTESDVVNFFHGIPIVPNGVHFVRNAHGKATGEAFVQVHAQESVHFALQRHKKMMGRRYIEVFKSSPVDMSNHLGRADARRQLHQQQVMHAQAHKAAAAVAAANSSNTIASSTATSARVPLPSLVASPFTLYPATQLSAQAARGGGGFIPHQRGHRQQHQQQQHEMQQSIQQHTFDPNKQDVPDLLDRANGQGFPSELSNGNNTASKRNGSKGSGHLSRSVVLRVVGLPDLTTPDDVVRLFDGLEMVGDGVHFVPSVDGTGSVGDIYVEFTSETWAKKALARSPMPVENQTVLVLRSSHSEMIGALTSSPDSTRHSDAGHTRPAGTDRNRRARPVSVPMHPQYSGPHGLTIMVGIAEAGSLNKSVSRGSDNVTAADGNHHRGGNDKCESEAVEGRASHFGRVSGLAGLSDEILRGLYNDLPGLCDNGVYLTREFEENKSVAFLAFRSERDLEGALEMFAEERPRSLAGLRLQAVNAGNAGNVLNFDDTLSGCIVRVTGLPKFTDQSDIVALFSGLEIPEGGIVCGVDGDGMASDSAWVRFVSPEQAAYAGNIFNQKPMGNSIIWVQNVNL
jgi:RNA recognition motif-containing protein